MGCGASAFEQESLESHNKYRAMHNCPPLKLNRALCRIANDYAQNLADRNVMEHSTDNRYGENLYMCTNMEISGDDAVRPWYEEVRLYNFNAAQFSSATGHFTQVVWKGTKNLGVGIAKRDNRTWVVANYDPPGNVQGRFRENVPPRCRER